MLFRKKPPSKIEIEKAAIDGILAAFVSGNDRNLATHLRNYRQQIDSFEPFRSEDEAFGVRFMDSPIEPFGALRADLKIAIACAETDRTLLDRITGQLVSNAPEDYYPRSIAQCLSGTPLEAVAYGLRYAVTALSDQEADAFYAAIDFGMEREAHVRLAAQALTDVKLYPVEDSFSGFGLLLLRAPGGIAALEILMQAVMAERDMWYGGGASTEPGLLPYVLPIIPAYEACKTFSPEVLGQETRRALSLSYLLTDPATG